MCFACMDACVPCVYGAQGGQERAPNTLDWKWQLLATMWRLGTNLGTFQLLIQLSIPDMKFLTTVINKLLII